MDWIIWEFLEVILFIHTIIVNVKLLKLENIKMELG